MLYDQIQEAAAAIRRQVGQDARASASSSAPGSAGWPRTSPADVEHPLRGDPALPALDRRVARGPAGLRHARPARPSSRWKGRFHFYEGYTLQQITFPVRVMKALGCDTLIVSNACGGMNPQYAKGDIMLIEDHINLMGDNPLIGPNDDRLGDRFPDMCHAYDRELLKLARRIALEEKIACQQGVFVAVPGPNLETRAEYRFLRTIGADVVGMSTVPEVIVAVHSKMRIAGLLVITDMCLPDALEPVSLPEIIAMANEAEKKLRVLVRRVVERMNVMW